MTIEALLEENNRLLGELIGLVKAGPAPAESDKPVKPKKEKAKAEPESEPKAEEKAPEKAASPVPKKISRPVLTDAMKKYMQANDKKALISLLSSNFGVRSLGELDEKDYGRAYELATEGLSV